MLLESFLNSIFATKSEFSVKYGQRNRNLVYPFSCRHTKKRFRCTFTMLGHDPALGAKPSGLLPPLEKRTVKPSALAVASAAQAPSKKQRTEGGSAAQVEAPPPPVDSSQDAQPAPAAAAPALPASAEVADAVVPEAVAEEVEAAPIEEAALAGPVQKKKTLTKAQTVALERKAHKKTTARLGSGSKLVDLLADAIAHEQPRGGGGPDESFGNVRVHWRKLCAAENAYRLEHDNDDMLDYKDFDASHLKRCWTRLCDQAQKKPTGKGSMKPIVKRARTIMKSIADSGAFGDDTEASSGNDDQVNPPARSSCLAPCNFRDGDLHFI